MKYSFLLIALTLVNLGCTTANEPSKALERSSYVHQHTSYREAGNDTALEEIESDGFSAETFPHDELGFEEPIDIAEFAPDANINYELPLNEEDYIESSEITENPGLTPELAVQDIQPVVEVTVPPAPQPATQPQPRVQTTSLGEIVNIRNTNIIGQGTLNVNGVIDYIRVRNRNPVLNEANIRRLVTLYIDEAAKEEVNHDIAIAQMLFWTAFLSSRQRVESNNFAGLSRTQNWNGSFPNMERGVKAHIQHLRGYARQTLKNPNDNVNPRWDNIAHLRGTVNTFEQLYHRWTQNTDRYRLNINIILSNLYRYCDARR